MEHLNLVAQGLAEIDGEVEGGKVGLDGLLSLDQPERLNLYFIRLNP